jgi:hypothetical protein
VTITTSLLDAAWILVEFALDETNPLGSHPVWANAVQSLAEYALEGKKQNLPQKNPTMPQQT